MAKNKKVVDSVVTKESALERAIRLAASDAPAPGAVYSHAEYVTPTPKKKKEAPAPKPVHPLQKRLNEAREASFADAPRKEGERRFVERKLEREASFLRREAEEAHAALEAARRDQAAFEAAIARAEESLRYQAEVRSALEAFQNVVASAAGQLRAKGETSPGLLKAAVSRLEAVRDERLPELWLEGKVSSQRLENLGEAINASLVWGRKALAKAREVYAAKVAAAEAARPEVKLANLKAEVSALKAEPAKAWRDVREARARAKALEAKANKLLAKF